MSRESCLSNAATARIEVSVPGPLRDCTGGQGYFEIEATTLNDAIDSLFRAYPRLRSYLYDESRHDRPRVLIYFDELNARWLADKNVVLRIGDRLAVLNGVS